MNVPGSYTCKCIGYVGDGKSNCKGKVFWFFKCYYQSVVFIVTKYLSFLNFVFILPLTAPIVRVTSSCNTATVNPLVRSSNARGVIQTKDGRSYLNDQNCRWNLSSNTMLQLQFATFSTDSSADYLTVYDGNSPSDPLIGRFSGSSVPAPITSSSNRLYVQFIRNSSGQAIGHEFKAWCRGMMRYATKHSMAQPGLKEKSSQTNFALVQSRFLLSSELLYT